MPIYTYEHPITKEQKDIVQRMSEVHKYFEDGVEWIRILSLPNVKVDTIDNLDPFDKRAFIKRTAKKGMTVGDMWDESAKLSDKRAKKLGKDPVKEAAENAYKKRTGKPHPHASKPKPKFIQP